MIGLSLAISLDRLEAFSSAHQFTIQALTALATIAAVVVSLGIAWATHRTNRTRLRAVASIVRVMGTGIDQNNPPRYLVVDITNKGQLPLWIDWGFFNWRVPLSGEYGQVNPLDAYAIPIPGTEIHPEVVKYPAQIAPRATRRFRLSTVEVFREEMVRDYARPGRLRRVCFRFQGAVLLTSDQCRFSVRLAESVKRELRAARSQGG